MYEWILPSLWEILAFHQSTVAECSSTKAERQWRLCVAAIEKLLLNTLANGTPDAKQGLVLASPAPIFSELKLTQSLQTVTFTNQPFNPLALMPFEMPTNATVVDQCASSESVLPLLKQDPLSREQFCLVFTRKFRLVLVLAEDNNGNKKFSFSFEPEVVEQSWRSLGARVMLSNPDLFAELEDSVQKYAPVTPDYRIVMKFSQLLLQQLPEEAETREAVEGQGEWGQKTALNPQFPVPDVELLQAFAHEVRTPLTTIRTITRLLLKRRELPANVIKRLEMIDHECTEQIDRMELLFRAAELETSTTVKPTSTQLTAMSLDQVLKQSIPRWQLAATRRNLTLDVVLPQQLPTVVSNPNMLDRALTGLIENFTRNLPSGSHIQVRVIPAGNQLKLQLLPKLQSQDETITTTTAQCQPPIRKALGHLLTFQPETGTIGLNFAATKHLFQAIGGKLTVKERPLCGEVLTIYLPLEVNNQPIGATT